MHSTVTAASQTAEASTGRSALHVHQSQPAICAKQLSYDLVTLPADASSGVDAKERLLHLIASTERGAAATSMQRGHIAEAQVRSRP